MSDINNSNGSSNTSSDAQNFLSFISAGVDPRTGSYSCRIPFSTLMGNALEGPSLPLELRFNPLKQADVGFGYNWEIPLTYYDRNLNMLHLSSGASYAATFEKGVFKITNEKVKNFTVSTNGPEILIHHKSGVVEVLTPYYGRAHEWPVGGILSAQGRALRFTYPTNSRRLAEVRDDSRRLLTVDVKSGNSTVITVWPDDPENRMLLTLDLRTNPGYTEATLRSLSLTGGDPKDKSIAASWWMQYEKHYLRAQRKQIDSYVIVISELVLPTGAVERVKYQRGAFDLTNVGTNREALPAVISHEVMPGGGQPAITRDYTYSKNNYLMKNQVFGSSYYYDSTETLSAEGVTRTIRRTFDRFHLLVNERTEQGGMSVETRTDYHAISNLHQTAQPSNFQLPLRAETIYKDSARPTLQRSEVTLTDYDIYGNLLKRTLPSGIVESYEYYPIQGEDGCPADAQPMVRWVKNKRLYPAAADKEAVAEGVRRTHVRYQLLRSKEWPFHVVEQTALSVDSLPSVKSRWSRLQQTLTYDYDADIKSPYFGRLTKKTEKLPSGSPLVFDYRYERQGDVLKTLTTMKRSEQSAHKSSWQNILNGQQVRTEDEAGLVIEMAFDPLGRMIHEAIAPNTEHQASKSYSYSFANGPTGAAELLSVDVTGMKTRKVFDGLGREVMVEIQDMDQTGQPMRTIYTAGYNALGQQVAETHFDWLDGRRHDLRTRHEFDDWGNRRLSRLPDGSSLINETDPLTLTVTRLHPASGGTLSVKNLFGKDQTVSRIGASGAVEGVTQYSYDGLGRCFKRVCPRKQVTRFVYDEAGRITSTLLPDGNRIRKQYQQGTLDNLPTLIAVNNYVAGTRAYDGLGRLVRSTIGDRSEQWLYEGGKPHPKRHLTQSGVVTEYSYEPAFNGEVSESTVLGEETLSSAFKRDPKHAGLTQAKTWGSEQNRSYYPSGKLKSEQQQEGKKSWLVNYRYSLKGLLLEKRHSEGDTQVLRYDSICRLHETEQGSLRVRFIYDGQSRVYRTETKDKQSEKELITEFSFDTFGRESVRKVSVDNGISESISQAFDPADKLLQRTYRRGDQVLRDERYTYDARGRMVVYECAGPSKPVDSGGKEIVSQLYKFNHLDCVTSLKTVFPDGENMATYGYGNRDQCQLTSVSNSHPDYAAQNATFKYDIDGHQLNDEKGRRLNYDKLGRLTSVSEVQK